MREVTAVPIFGIGDYQIGRGIVGGPVLQSIVLGKAAAQSALRVLKGEAPSQINPVHVDFGAPMYDWRELKRWNVSEALLSPDSIVYFREPSVWQQYRWQIIGAVAIVLLQSALIGGLLIERDRRRRAAEQVSNHFAEASPAYRTRGSRLRCVRLIVDRNEGVRTECFDRRNIDRNLAERGRKRRVRRRRYAGNGTKCVGPTTAARSIRPCKLRTLKKAAAAIAPE